MTRSHVKSALSVPKKVQRRYFRRSCSAVELIRLEFDISRLNKQLASLDRQRSAVELDLKITETRVSDILATLTPTVKGD